jgi:hypothetical protein
LQANNAPDQQVATFEFEKELGAGDAEATRLLSRVYRQGWTYPA